MQQVATYIAGERTYSLIKGGTGPLVYPGAHVYIYRLLFSVTDQGRDIRSAQIIFAVLYLVTLVVVMACYRKAKAPPYLFPLLVLSKRLHSIYVLRLFNDCWAVLFLWLAIYAYQHRQWTIGSFAYTTALGVKMSVLLVLPAIGTILLQALGRDRAITQALVIGQMQVLFGYEFLVKNTPAYFASAFQLSRAFLYEWTVNWRFVPEHIFLSGLFSKSLLAAQLSLLLVFGWTRWLAPTKSSARRRSIKDIVALFLSSSEANDLELDIISKRLSPRFILTSIASANAIGMLCARSLHYQFYSWLCWMTPFLLWRSGLGPLFVVPVWAAQEWAWNVFPSTDISSAVVVACLALQTLGVWWGTRTDVEEGGHKHKE